MSSGRRRGERGLRHPPIRDAGSAGPRAERAGAQQLGRAGPPRRGRQPILGPGFLSAAWKGRPTTSLCAAPRPLPGSCRPGMEFLPLADAASTFSRTRCSEQLRVNVGTRVPRPRRAPRHTPCLGPPLCQPTSRRPGHASERKARLRPFARNPPRVKRRRRPLSPAKQKAAPPADVPRHRTSLARPPSTRRPAPGSAKAQRAPAGQPSRPSARGSLRGKSRPPPATRPGMARRWVCPAQRATLH